MARQAKVARAAAPRDLAASVVVSEGQTADAERPIHVDLLSR